MDTNNDSKRAKVLTFDPNRQSARREDRKRALVSQVARVGLWLLRQQPISSIDDSVAHSVDAEDMDTFSEDCETIERAYSDSPHAGRVAVIELIWKTYRHGYTYGAELEREKTEIFFRQMAG